MRGETGTFSIFRHVAARRFLAAPTHRPTRPEKVECPCFFVRVVQRCGRAGAAAPESGA